MKLDKETLITELIEFTRRHINEGQTWLEMDLKSLQWRPDDNSWSILENVEHLNRYGDYYIPEIKQRMAQAQPAQEINFHSGALGNYFAKAMLPRPKLNKMKTFKDKNPLGASLDKTVIQKFLAQQEELIKILVRARKISITKIKTGITISNFIKLRLGDTLRVVIYHNYRHAVQIEKLIHLHKVKAIGIQK